VFLNLNCQISVKNDYVILFTKMTTCFGIKGDYQSLYKIILFTVLYKLRMSYVISYHELNLHCIASYFRNSVMMAEIVVIFLNKLM
jgi:hypothetical protein